MQANWGVRLAYSKISFCSWAIKFCRFWITWPITPAVSALIWVPKVGLGDAEGEALGLGEAEGEALGDGVGETDGFGETDGKSSSSSSSSSSLSSRSLPTSEWAAIETECLPWCSFATHETNCPWFSTSSLQAFWVVVPFPSCFARAGDADKRKSRDKIGNNFFILKVKTQAVEKCYIMTTFTF